VNAADLASACVFQDNSAVNSTSSVVRILKDLLLSVTKIILNVVNIT